MTEAGKVVHIVILNNYVKNLATNNESWKLALTWIHTYWSKASFPLKRDKVFHAIHHFWNLHIKFLSE
jgi:hypothetical protein